MTAFGTPRTRMRRPAQRMPLLSGTRVAVPHPVSCVLGLLGRPRPRAHAAANAVI